MVDAGWKMNPETRGKYRRIKSLSGFDEIVECEDCGWTWWVHRG